MRIQYARSAATVSSSYPNFAFGRCTINDGSATDHEPLHTVSGMIMIIVTVLNDTVSSIEGDVVCQAVAHQQRNSLLATNTSFNHANQSISTSHYTLFCVDSVLLDTVFSGGHVVCHAVACRCKAHSACSASYLRLPPFVCGPNLWNEPIMQEQIIFPFLIDMCDVTYGCKS